MGYPVVEVSRLVKAFNGFVAVNDLSFSIETGEILGLLGPNGAGKTTLIQMLLGLITPTAGEIRILGLDLRRHREEILSQVNFSSTYVSLPTSLTVRENLTVFAKLYGIRKPERRIDELLEIFEIKRLKKTLTRHLSSGQLTRLSLAKALLNHPKVLFLDEPTASLDPDIADKTRRLLKSIRDQSRLTLLYTSHNMKEMEEISDRILFLHQGRILASGTPAEIVRRFAEKNLEDVFLKVARGSHLPERPEIAP
ncbi:MAG: ABC transporter ATP-binding protein [Candidatus Manganitrophus sp. SB1]|nr:ABC transporter ATP-binding protein [Candidatus Manganitrophus morganii]